MINDFDKLYNYIHKLDIHKENNSHFYKDICLSLIISSFSI